MTGRKRRRWIDPQWRPTICNICGGCDTRADGSNGHNSACPFGPDPVIATAVAQERRLAQQAAERESQ